MTPDVIFPDLFLFIRLSPRYGLLLSRFFQPSAAAPFRLHSVCGACMFCPGDRRENSFPVLRFLCSRNGFVIVQQLPCRAFGRDCRAQFILRYFPHHLLTIIGRSAIMRRKKFTLIELLVVIAIIAIVVASKVGFFLQFSAIFAFKAL